MLFNVIKNPDHLGVDELYEKMKPTIKKDLFDIQFYNMLKAYQDCDLCGTQHRNMCSIHDNKHPNLPWKEMTKKLKSQRHLFMGVVFAEQPKADLSKIINEVKVSGEIGEKPE